MFFDFIDANCQLLHPDIDRERLSEVKEEGIQGAVHIASDPTEWERLSHWEKNQSFTLYKGFGLHPVRVAAFEDEEEVETSLDQLSKYLGQAQALGAIGLDYRPGILGKSREIQIHAFQLQLELGLALGLPFLLHLKQCHGDAIRILDFWGQPKPSGFILDFEGSLSEARDWVQRGYSLSFGKRILRKPTKKTLSVLRELPLENLILESSSPIYFPYSPKVQVGGPLDLWEVAHFVAQLREIRASELLEISTANIRRILMS